MLRREQMIRAMKQRSEPWDVLVIGGGATGAGVAVDAASRGYSVCLVERSDFGAGTSSRSTKLIHGGVRYLQQGNVSLVLEALRERTILRRNAPHLVHDLAFVVPVTDWWEGPFYGVGLKVYDLLAGRHGFGKSRLLTREETAERLPNVERRGLRGGVVYHDGQFDDARLVVELALTAVREGAVVANYVEVVELLTRGGAVDGAIVEDRESNDRLELRARVVVNATGVFADQVRALEEVVPALVRPSQGVHLVLDRRFLPGDHAILVPHTDDGRVIFVLPWKGRVLVGTTDTAVDEPSAHPKPLPEEVAFLLEHAGRHLAHDPGPEDVLSAFAGLRPLVRNEDAASTSSLSRDHVIHVSRGGLVTITGGKWTTYRKMAEDAVDRAAEVGGLEDRPCRTEELPIGEPGNGFDVLDVRRATTLEMACRVEDVLSRRTRMLLLDARAAWALAPRVAREMAQVLGHDPAWEARELESFSNLVQDSLPEGMPLGKA